MRRFRFLLLLLSVALQAVVGLHEVFAQVTTCVGSVGVGICSSSGSECTVSGAVRVAPSAVLDCSGKNLVVSGRVYVEDGSFTLLAESVRVSAAGVVEAVADDAIPGGFSLATTGDLTVEGQLLAENRGPGTIIELQAGGNIVLGGQVDPVVRASGITQASDGGEVNLTAAGVVRIFKTIQINGKPAGTEANSNTGGALYVESGGDAEIAGKVVAFGRFFNGGDVTVVAGRDAILSANLELDGRSPDGYGGELYVRAARRVVLSGQVYAPGGSTHGGGQAAGGLVSLVSGCGGTTVSGAIDVTAGQEGGGEVVLISDGDISISSTINASGVKNGGRGGDISIAAGRVLAVTQTGLIQANGHSAASSGDRAGGNIELVGCQVDVRDGTSTGAVIEARGAPGGFVNTTGRRGSLIAGDATDYSVRIGDRSRTDAGGQHGGAAGTVRVAVSQSRSGWCQIQPGISCSVVSQCPLNGLTYSPCVGNNPDYQGVLSQFAPTPILVVDPALGSCSAACQ